MNVGKKFPDFNLKDKEGKNYSLKSFNSNYKIIYFYPKDNTPGCTIEAKEFSSKISSFKKLNTEVIGISGGDEDSKRKFCDKHNLDLILLSDPDFLLSKRLGVYGEKSFMGRKYFGISRVTFVVDESNKIIKIFDRVKPLIHANEVLKFIREQYEK